jgi:hypothetical protein
MYAIARERCSTSARRMRIASVLLILLLAYAAGTIAVCAGAKPASADASAKSARKKHRNKPAAEETPMALPDDVKVPRYSPGQFPFHDGERLVYQASWIGIPAARGWFELHRDPKNPALWKVEAWIETNKLVDLFFRMRDYMREQVAAESLRTRDIYQLQRENQRSNEYTIAIDERNHLVVSTKKNRKGSETHQFVSNDPFGPISGAMMALSQDLAPGNRLLFDVFSGTNRYVFYFTVQDKERVRVPVGTFDAFRVSPGIVYLSNGKLRGQARETTVWISADRQHLPLRMEASTFIGVVRADLVQIDGAPVEHE